MFAIAFDLVVADTARNHPKGVSQAYADIGGTVGGLGLKSTRGGPVTSAISRTISPSRITFRASHSHTTKTRQPAALSAVTLRRSRSALLSNFGSQKSRRLLGSRASLHAGSEWRCQKHP